MRFRKGEIVRGGPPGHWTARVEGFKKIGRVEGQAVAVTWLTGPLAGREALVERGLEKLPAGWLSG